VPADAAPQLEHVRRVVRLRPRLGEIALHWERSGLHAGPGLVLQQAAMVNERLIIVHQLTVRCGSKPLGSVKAQIRKTPPAWRLGLGSARIDQTSAGAHGACGRRDATELEESRRLTADSSGLSMFVPLR